MDGTREGKEQADQICYKELWVACVFEILSDIDLVE